MNIKVIIFYICLGNIRTQGLLAMDIDKLTMDIKMDPSAIISGSSAVEIEDLALVPALVILSHRREVE